MVHETEHVNGIVVGVGHFQEPQHTQVINGVNIDLFFFSPMAVILSLNGGGPYEGPDSTRYRYEGPTTVRSNGVNLALGGYIGGVEHNGLSVGMYSFCKAVNGLSIAVAYNRVGALHGVHVATLGNLTHTGSGVHIGLYNRANTMHGLQLGIVNKVATCRGIQIGFFNRSESARGLQLGFVNTNAKRTLPLINF